MPTAADAGRRLPRRTSVARRAGSPTRGGRTRTTPIMHASGDLAESAHRAGRGPGLPVRGAAGGRRAGRGLGRAGRARRSCASAARRLRERFEADFWLADEAFYALALDGERQPCRVVTSNAGHLLWTGLASDSARPHRWRAASWPTTCSPAGASARSPAASALYNPMSYHNGSVWPHDTAIAAVGMRRYGLVDAVPDAGHRRSSRRCCSSRACGCPSCSAASRVVDGYGPTRYPVACSPQAWAAGVVFKLIAAMLGLSPDAADNQLTLNRPRLPAWLSWIELRGPAAARRRASRCGRRRGRMGRRSRCSSRTGDAELVVRR